jgi:hypothetical protein
VDEGHVISFLDFGQRVEEGAFVWRQAIFRPSAAAAASALKSSAPMAPVAARP